MSLDTPSLVPHDGYSTTGSRVALVPGALALLPQYAGLEDPVAELRAACLEAVRWLGRDVTVLADAQGARVAAYLLAAVGGGFETGLRPSSTTGATGLRPSSTTGTTGLRPSSTTGSVLVVGNGSACRTERAPGHLDERAHGFDEALGATLRAGRPEVDTDLAAELWAGVAGIERMRDLGGLGEATVDYDDDPYGVQYWVMRWES